MPRRLGAPSEEEKAMLLNALANYEGLRNHKFWPKYSTVNGRLRADVKCIHENGTEVDIVCEYYEGGNIREPYWHFASLWND